MGCKTHDWQKQDAMHGTSVGKMHAKINHYHPFRTLVKLLLLAETEFRKHLKDATIDVKHIVDNITWKLLYPDCPVHLMNEIVIFA